MDSPKSSNYLPRRQAGLPQPHNHSLQKDSTSSLARWFKLIAILVSLATLSLGLILISTKLQILPAASTNSPFLSPIASSLFPLNQQRQFRSGQKIVFGFLPFWNLDEADNLRYQYLSHLAYFGIELDNNGEITKRLSDGTLDPGWNHFRKNPLSTILSSAKSNQTNIVLVLRVLKNDNIQSLVSSQKNRSTAIKNTLSLVREKNFSGINIDFEYAGTPPDSVKRDFTLFVRQLTDTLRREHPNIHITIDMFADSASKDRLWQIVPISQFVDHIIIMAYDFHRPSSPNAGPIAPLHGGCQAKTDPSCHYDYDVSQALSDFTDLVSPQKLILGVPYYGYQWQTTRLDPYSHTFPNTGALASFNRIQAILSNDSSQDITNLQTGWDEQALSPYLTFETADAFQVIWYENPSSLGLKYDLVNQAGLAGIAIWALGYDGQYDELWDLLDQSLPQNL